MSYLALPRLTFAGRFQADVSTVNNDAANYSLPDLPPDADLGWNPGGTGAWRLVGCTVRSVVYADGTSATTPEEDPVIGLSIMGASDRPSAKLVDLDPQNQGVSQIWGLRIRLGGNDGDLVAGEYRPTAFMDLYGRVSDPSFKGMPTYGAGYQSVVEGLAWTEAETGSRFLKELRARSPDRLSIKFNVDGFNPTPDTPGFTFGRIVGTIGPSPVGEPAQFVRGRLLSPPQGSAFNHMPCLVDKESSTLTVDWGNSFLSRSPGGPMDQSAGDLFLVCTRGSQAIFVKWVADEGDAYERTAGVETFNLSPYALDFIDAGQLALVSSTPASIMLQEAPMGAFLRAEDFVFRMQPGERVRVTIHALAFGKPVAGLTIPLGLQAVPTLAAKTPIGTAAAALPPSQVRGLSFPSTVVTDKDGIASFEMVAGEPWPPRGNLDGQVYTVLYGSQDPSSAAYNPDPNAMLSLHVYDAPVYPEHPDWETHVQPVLQQYQNLYPVMGRMVQRGDRESVGANLDILDMAFRLPVEDPNHMPATRDLSEAKRAMILRWIADQRTHTLKVRAVGRAPATIPREAGQ